MKKITHLLLLLILCVSKSIAQPVSGYLFSESTETYTPVVGTNSSAAGDDGSENGISIGFPFNYAGTSYTTFSINTNGWIRLGADVNGQSWVNNLSNTSEQSPLIAAFWDDHNRSSGTIKYSVIGLQPARTLEIGWDNITISNGGNTSLTSFGSFKMRLYESTGKIEFIYGPVMDSAGVFSASIGLNDAASFLSVTPGAVSTVSNSTADNGINSTASLLGKKFIFTPQPQCSGLPAPGNTISSVASACSNIQFTLSLQNQIPGFGATYQWESSTNGIDFTPISGAITQTLALNQSVPTTYHCIVTCGGNSTTSNPVQVLSTTGSECYCSPAYTNGKTDGDLISNVTITGTTMANNTGTDPVNPYYTYFTGQPNYTATLNSGYSYTINVTVGTYENQNEAVWVDYNDDSVFSPNERVGYSEPIGSNGTGTFPITLSCDAPAGVHRMRIRDAWSTAASTIDPCATYGYGETEDYDITIVSAPGCQPPIDLASVTIEQTDATLNWQVGCGQIAWDISLTAPGAGVPSGAPTNSNVHHPAIIPNLTAGTTYDFYVRGNCGVNGYSDWAGPFTFTTLAPGPDNDDCPGAVALIPGGNFEQHAVVGTNVSATKSTGVPGPTCAISGFGGDVWYSTVVPSDGNITIEVQPDPGSPFIDSALMAFTGDCGNLTVIGCSDDDGIDAFSRLDLTGLTPNETIYARVWEYANDTFGTFRISAWNTLLKTDDFKFSQFRVYPNPVKDVLEITGVRNITNIEVYNLLGQLMIAKPLHADQAKIDMALLAQGTYMVKVYTSDTSETIKVIKE